MISTLHVNMPVEIVEMSVNGDQCVSDDVMFFKPAVVLWIYFTPGYDFKRPIKAFYNHV